ncbi:hypothetical protein pipiens_004789 [Culex pipiens pipiens]|uniref:F-box domain-containing protein n=1 Tax=Culex pipiens pipiens TaxID=38569 RepID=A0ABD1CF08_CULPP
MDASPAFPAKIWVKIFGNLSAFQLTRARLVCRQWYGIVCGEPSLIGKFTIARVEDFADEERNVNKPAALEAMHRYVRVRLVNAINIPLDTSWLALGENLTFLSMDACCIGTDALVEMLRRAVNLESLRMNDRYCFLQKCQTAINFKLEKMRNLDLRVEDLSEALRVLGQICSPLKTLKIMTIWNDESLDKFRSYLPFLQCVTLDTTLPDDSFVKLLPTTLLHLSITFANVRERYLPLDLSGYHNPNLKTLKLSRFHLPRESFLQCCQHCPNINNLSLGQCSFEDPTEMSTAIALLPSLATLTLLVMSEYLPVECPAPWTVTELALYSCSVSEQAVTQLARQCPQLAGICFDRCAMTGSTVVAMWRQFGARLKSVTLHDCRSLGCEFVDCFVEQRCQLERLTVWNCRLDNASKQRLRVGLGGVHLKLK